MELLDKVQKYDSDYILDHDIKIIDPKTGFQTRLINLILSDVAGTNAHESNFSQIMKEILSSRETDFLLESLQQRIRNSVLPPVYDDDKFVFYDTNQEYSFSVGAKYGEFVNMLIQGKDRVKRLEIEKIYNNSDDLLYDIYRANKIAEFFCSYAISIDPKEFGSSYALNILYPFIYNKNNTPGFKQFQTQKILSRQTFLENFERDKALFPEVVEELDNPNNILTRNANKLVEKHNSNIVELKKASIFNAYVRNMIIPMINNNIDNNKDKFIEKFGDVIKAKETMTKQILSYANDFYNPFKRDNVAFKQVNEIFSLYMITVLDISLYNDEILKRELGILEDATWPEVIVSLNKVRPPIDLDKVSKAGRTIKIFSNGTEPREFRALAPTDTSVPFTIGLKTFSSVDEYIIYKVYSENMKYSPELIQKLLPEGRSRFKTEVERYVKNRVYESMTKYVNLWLEVSKNKELIESTKGKNILFGVESKFLGKNGKNMLGKYLMLIREESSKTIKNPIIVNWVQTKIADMKNAIAFAKDKLKANLDSRAQILNFLNTVYNFRSINSDLRVEVSAKDTNPAILSYLNKFVAYTLSIIDEKDFEKFYKEGDELQKSINRGLSIYQKNKFITEFIYYIKKSILKKKAVMKKYTLEDLSFVLSLINNRDVNISSEKEAEEFLDNKRIAFFLETLKHQINITEEMLEEEEETQEFILGEKEESEDEEEKTIEEEELFSEEEEPLGEEEED